MWEYIKEIFRLRGIDVNRVRKFLERNEIFIKVFSSILLACLSLVVSYWGYQLNERNVEINEMNAELNKQNVKINEINAKINRQNAKISERQFEIVENDKNPYFIFECEDIWEEVEETERTGKIANHRYTITNKGGNISNVYMDIESYIFIYLETDRPDAYHVFKYRIDNFLYKHPFYPCDTENNKFVFYEHTSEENSNEYSDKAYWLYKYFEQYLPNFKTLEIRKFVNISYNDYAGREKEDTFEFYDSNMQKTDKNKTEIEVGLGLGWKAVESGTGRVISEPIDTDNIPVLGNALKERIEKCLEEREIPYEYNVPFHIYGYVDWD